MAKFSDFSEKKEKTVSPVCSRAGIVDCRSIGYNDGVWCFVINFANVVIMRFLIISPEKTVLDVAATSVVVPLVDGEYGLMSGHTPLIARVGAGEIRATTETGAVSYYVEGGVIEVLDDVVAALTMYARPVGQLNVAAAEAQYQEVLARPGNTMELATVKSQRLNEARAKLRVAKKKS